jgi:peptidoglycan/xylan/chitin deacetylase (PgdA/CDA1 family)
VNVKLAISLCMLSLLSLLTAAGCQRTEIPEPEPVVIPPDAKLVSLFFDDCFLNQYEVALPVLLEHDFKATFGVITGSIGKGHSLWEYMDEKRLKELAGYGMDIGGHTKTHPHLTDGLTDEQLREEIIESKRHLEKMGFRVSTMVYPYYEWDGRVIEYVKEAGYTCARAGWNKEKAYDLQTTDPQARYHVFSWQITDQDMEKFKQYLGEAGPNSLVGLTYHFIADDGPEETSTPVASFQVQMDYLREAGFTVVRLPDLFRQ